MSEPKGPRPGEIESGEALTVERMYVPGSDAAAESAPRSSGVQLLGGALADGALEADERGAQRYLIDRQLGAGGMGEVWLARDPRIGRQVAVKTIRGRRAEDDDESSDRFLREARVQGQLEHPAIVPVYDLGRDPSGTLYFTMKRVRGLSLATVIERLREGDPVTGRTYSRRKLLTAFTSVCMAVDFAHAHGVLHRDLKPANVMLGDFGEVYVLDWGLARLLSDEHEKSSPLALPEVASTPLTIRGQILGTPGYMAPEQARGHLDRLDARTDVYALGAMLYEILSLEPLHVGPTPAELLVATLAEVDARPSQRAPLADVPPELDAVCATATALDPAARFASARALCDAVERYLDGDRDLERRRQLATEAVEQARQLAERAFASADGGPERKQAMAEVSRALAFDPESPDARRLLVRLLSEPPRQLPPEVVSEQQRSSAAFGMLGARTGAIAYLSYFLYVPLMLMRGVRSVPAMMVSIIPWVLAAVLALVAVRKRRLGRPMLRAIEITTMVAVASLAISAGPFVVPIGAITVAAAMCMVNPASERRLIIGLACAAVVVPFALEWVHLVPPSYELTSRGMLMLPRVAELPSVWSVAFFIAIGLGGVLTATMVVANLRDALTTTQLRLQLLTWQLRGLLPPADSENVLK